MGEFLVNINIIFIFIDIKEEMVPNIFEINVIINKKKESNFFHNNNNKLINL